MASAAKVAHTFTPVFLLLPIVVSGMMSFDGREYLGQILSPDYSLH